MWVLCNSHRESCKKSCFFIFFPSTELQEEHKTKRCSFASSKTFFSQISVVSGSARQQGKRNTRSAHAPAEELHRISLWNRPRICAGFCTTFSCNRSYKKESWNVHANSIPLHAPLFFFSPHVPYGAPYFITWPTFIFTSYEVEERKQREAAVRTIVITKVSWLCSVDAPPH